MNNINGSRKFFWVVGIVLAALYFSPTIIGMLHRLAAAATPPATAVTAKPSPIVPGATASAPSVPTFRRCG